MQDQPLTPTQIRTVFYVIRKHKWKITTLFLSTVITVAVGSLLATPIYRAISQLLVKPGREDVYVSPTGGSPAVINYTGQDQKVNSEIAILRSPGLVIELVNHFGPNRLFDYPDHTLKTLPFFNGWFLKENKRKEIPPIEMVYKSVLNSTKISHIRNSNVINVAFDWPDPVIAAQVVNKLVDLYLAQHVKVHTDPQTYSLLEKQAKKWEEKLRESEKKLEAFKRRHSITSLPQQKTILLGKLSQIESQNKETESEIQETVEMIAALKAQLSNLDENVQLTETVNKQSDTLTALKAKLVDLELQGLKEEIRRVKQIIAEEEKKEQKVVVSGKSPIRQSLEGELLKARTRLKTLKTRQKNQSPQMASYRQKLKALDGLEKEIREFEREVAINEANHKLYLTKFEEAKISENMDKQKIANVSVIEPAIPPLKAIKPKKRLNVMIASLLGLLAGIGMAFLIELINPVFRTREDIDQFLGLPVLATLPKEKAS
jgi:uncharacterized protein involved in exopolysaccharide biosynthesis